MSLIDEHRAWENKASGQYLKVVGWHGLPSGFVSLSFLSKVSSVAKDTETTVLTYTVPAGKTLILKKIEVGGENIAKWSVQFDAVEDAIKRTFLGSSLNESFDYELKTLAEGVVLTVKVEHKRPPAADFEARVIGIVG